MKKYFVLTVLLLFLSNAYWLYKSIDFGITYSYQQVTLEDKLKEINILGNLLIEGAKNYTKKDMLVTLRKQNPGLLIVEKEDRISINGVNFIYNGDTLVSVQ